MCSDIGKTMDSSSIVSANEIDSQEETFNSEGNIHESLLSREKSVPYNDCHESFEAKFLAQFTAFMAGSSTWLVRSVEVVIIICASYCCFW